MKTIRLALCVMVFGIIPAVTGCSDLMDSYGDLLPGFLKPAKKTEEPKIHKLKPTGEIKTSAPTGVALFTPSAMIPIVDKDAIPGKPGAGGPVTPGKEKPTIPEKTSPPAGLDKDTKTAAPDKTKPAEKTVEKPAEKPAKTDESKTTPATPTKSTPEKVTGDGSVSPGEDVAMVALIPEAGAPEVTPGKPINPLMDTEYVYDPTGKRDPFRPINLKIEKKSEVPIEALTPLQRYNLSQLKLTAIIYDPERETGIAMVEAPDKKGYNIFVGSEIGGGKVIRITETEVQVEVVYDDFYGSSEKRIEILKIAGGK